MTGRLPQPVVGALFVTGAIISWGSYFPFAKMILDKLSPEVFLVFRLGIGSAVLLCLSLRLKKSLKIARADWLSIVGAAVIGIIVHQIIQLTGLIYTTATNTGWILTLIPPTTGILGWLFLKERVGWRQVAGIMIAAAGVLLFVSRGSLADLSLVENYGDLLALLSVFTWSIYTVLTKSRLSSYHPLPVSTLHMAIGFGFFAATAGWRIPGQVSSLTPLDWLVVVLIGILPSGLAYYWWNAGLQRLSAINTSMFLFIQAIITTTLGFYLLGEGLTLTMALFIVMIITGVTIAQSARRPRFRAKQGGF